MKWPTDGLYIDELIDKLLKKFKKPRSGYQDNMKSKLLKLKQASADANITTIDDLTDYLHERY
jgi:hypothetical protein|tara:strand:+ start:164 stop:352 length:189 start_codon:yes stop_codon:yes gene_type:complete